jgi:L-ascorbate metabolism protein UlaG (beta-lactamase superfamily)
LPVSDHFNGKTFFQPGAHPERGFRDVLRWRFTSKPAKWPSSVALAPQPPPPAPVGDQIVATWLGHASFLIQTTHGNVLLDPVFSDRVSPVTWAGPRRVHAVPIALDALPRIDAVCVSHDHYDHFDVATLRTLARDSNAVFIAPLRHRDLLESAGAKQIVELDWWQKTTLPGGLDVQLTPTKHWTKRLGSPRNHRLWGGFWLRVPRAHSDGTPAQREPRQIWFVGDSGYDEPFFRELHARCGPPDLALVPIGAYEPRWFLAPMHMNPDEAVRLHRDVGAKLSLAMHWGTFQLTDEAREEPVRALEAARAKYGVAADAFRVLAPGESVVV